MQPLYRLDSHLVPIRQVFQTAQPDTEPHTEACERLCAVACSALAELKAAVHGRPMFSNYRICPVQGAHCFLQLRSVVHLLQKQRHALHNGTTQTLIDETVYHVEEGLLWAACWGCDLKLLQAALQRGANPNACEAGGCTALEYCCYAFCDALSTDTEAKWLPLIEVLLAAKARIRSPKEGQSLLSYAAAFGARDLIKLLVTHASSHGHTLLHHVCFTTANKAVAQLLLEYGADPNAGDFQGRTPLHMACMAESEEIVELLIAHGASPTALTTDGCTPLHLAVECGHLAHIARFAPLASRLSLLDAFKYGCLHYCEERFTPRARLLLRALSIVLAYATALSPSAEERASLLAPIIHVPELTALVFNSLDDHNTSRRPRHYKNALARTP